MKKKIIKIWLIFEVEKGFGFAIFDLQYQIKPSTYLEPFDLWSCLLTTKLSYPQLFK